MSVVKCSFVVGLPAIPTAISLGVLHADYGTTTQYIRYVMLIVDDHNLSVLVAGFSLMGKFQMTLFLDLLCLNL